MNGLSVLRGVLGKWWGKTNAMSAAVKAPEQTTLPPVSKAIASQAILSPRIKTRKPIGLAYYQLEARCGYLKMRRLLLELAGLPDEPNSPVNTLPQGKAGAISIHVEADPKQVLLEMDGGLELVRVGEVLGVIVRFGNGEEIRWRNPEHLWGKIRGETIEKLAHARAYIISTKRVKE